MEAGSDEHRQAILLVAGDQATRAAGRPLMPRLLRRWRTIGVVVLIFTLLAVAYCLHAKTWYRAQVLMVAVQQDNSGSKMDQLSGGLGGIAALAGIDITGNDAFKKESLARLSSRSFTYKFLTDEGMLPILYYKRWDAEHGRWKSTDPEKQPTLERAFKMFNDKVRTISEDRRTSVIKVTVDWIDPALARDWANKLVTKFNADARDVARDEAQRSLEFLNRELAKTEVLDMRQTINGLIENETRKSMLASVREQYAFKIIDPAFLPGKEGIVWPKPVLLIVLAVVFGSLVGSLVVVATERRETGE
jgi:uncharacterized protein involved in exopolysaccharide biosynthesis